MRMGKQEEEKIESILFLYYGFVQMYLLKVEI